MPDDLIDRVETFASGLIGMECCHVGTGGAVGTTFSMDFGGPLEPREYVIKNPSLPDRICRFHSEARLFAWCVWRIQCEGRPIATCDSKESEVQCAFDRLVGRDVTSAHVTGPFIDLHLSFDNGCELQVLSSFFGKPSYASKSNWFIGIQREQLYVCVNTKCEFSERVFY